jgi:hypothetical protein
MPRPLDSEYDNGPGRPSTTITSSSPSPEKARTEKQIIDSPGSSGSAISISCRAGSTRRRSTADPASLGAMHLAASSPHLYPRSCRSWETSVPPRPGGGYMRMTGLLHDVPRPFGHFFLTRTSSPISASPTRTSASGLSRASRRSYPQPAGARWRFAPGEELKPDEIPPDQENRQGGPKPSGCGSSSR